MIFQDTEVIVDNRKWRLSMNKKIVADLRSTQKRKVMFQLAIDK